MIKKMKIQTNEIDWHSALRNFFFLTDGSLIAAVNLNVFLAPAELAPGGVSGAAIITNKSPVGPLV